ncbi:MAG: helix-turn-helix domain-containing protein [Candidatus Tyrphobacter sp.]
MNNSERRDEDDETLTAQEAWIYLRIGRTAFYEGVRSGAIPHKRLGRKIIVYKGAIREWFGGPASREKKI